MTTHRPFFYQDGQQMKETLLATFQNTPLRSVRTPAMVIDRAIFACNCARMLENAKKLNARFRAHPKSHKTAEGTRLQLISDTTPHTRRSSAVVVSTLMEAWELLRSGLVQDGTVNDILYGVPIGTTQLAEASELTRELEAHGATFRVLVDHLEQVRALQTFNESSKSNKKWSVFVKVDSGLKRAGLPPKSPALRELLEALIDSPSISIFGFYTHAGHSYASTSVDDVLQILDLEIESVNDAASLALGLLSGSQFRNEHASPFILSVGSTPTANVGGMAATWGGRLNGVLELHAGNYPLHDLQQHSTNLIGLDQISLRVLTTVISHYPGRGPGGADEALCDAGSIALSKDSGPSGDFGLAMTLRVGRRDIDAKWKVVKISQEHGILRRIVPVPDQQSQSGGGGGDEILEVGSLVEIIPQHACLVAAAHPWFYIVDSDSADGPENIVDIWVPWKGCPRLVSPFLGVRLKIVDQGQLSPLRRADIVFWKGLLERPKNRLRMAEGSKLYLKAGTDYLDTILSDEDGFPLYKIETNHGATMHRVTIISKIDPETNNVKELAKIAWSFTKSSKLDYRGEEVDIDAFLPREGPFLHQHARTFKASDGRTYRWVLLRKTISLGVDFLELETDDVPPKVTARFHKEDAKKQIHGYLDIFGQGEKILDDILVTFVYCEKFRRERTGEAAHGPGAPYLLF